MSKEAKSSGSKSKHGHSTSSISGFKPKTSDSTSHQRPKDESAGHYNEGKKAINKKDYDKALECFDKAIEANPTKMHYYARKAEVLAEIGQTAKAKETLEKIDMGKLSTNPEGRLTDRILEKIEKKHPELFSDSKKNTDNLEVPEAKETKPLSNLKRLIEGRNKSNSLDDKKIKEENEQLKQENKQLKKENFYYQKFINDLKNAFTECENKAKSSTSSNNYDAVIENKEESSNLGGESQNAPDQI